LHFFKASKPALGPTQRPGEQITKKKISLGVKRPEGEADRTPKSSVQVNNEWSYTYNRSHMTS